VALHRSRRREHRRCHEQETADRTGSRLAGSHCHDLRRTGLNADTGAYRAVGLRSYDSKQDQWSIWWLDSRYPPRLLDPPAQGRFENGVGSFYASFEQDGRKIIGRLQWSAMTPTSAHWEQANSYDDGKTWQPNWIMELQRGR
jgi:hypothetical protein